MGNPAVTVHAPAKLNLFLHAVGRRADGYHLIESLVAFATLGDELTASAAETLSLTVKGEFAQQAGTTDTNLVMRAANLLKQRTNTPQGAALTLRKNIPVGAGLGGGSADAAAALRALNELWKLALPMDALLALAPELGADVAMCLSSQPALAQGIGELLTPLPWQLPALHAVLVHPRIPLLTAEVYGAMRDKNPSPWKGEGRVGVMAHPLTQTSQEMAPPGPPPSLPLPGGGTCPDFAELIAALSSTRNDLQDAATRVSPVVMQVLQALEKQRSGYVRMSGSGACCYALYATSAEAARAAQAMRQDHPEWWVVATELA